MSRITWSYTIIAYLITWSISLTSYYLYKSGIITSSTLNLVYNFGALGPFLAAYLCARVAYGKEGVRKLMWTLNFKTLNRKSLAISLSPLLFLVIALLIYPLITGHWFSFRETERQFNLVSGMSYINWLLPFITYSIFEEFGWRGFLLPHLQQKHSAFRATIILTIIWACWHLPFFLWRFQFSLLITVGFFFSIFVGALILTSTFNFSRGSIASTILFHFANNIASAMDKEYLVAIVSVCFILLAIYLVRKYGPKNLCDGERTGNFYAGL